MGIPNQTDCLNRLLALMSATDFALIAPHLRPVELPGGFVLGEPDQPIAHVYVPEACIASVVAVSAAGLEVEAGLFGRDGLGPAAVLMGTDRSPSRTLVQVAGGGHRIAREALVGAMGESPTLRALLLGYAQALSIQTAFTALSNAVHPIDQRLGRWLLMCHDRAAGDEVALTHEFLSTMLAVRRPSVTTALHVLEGQGLIRAERGRITIRNRAALELFAGDAYGRPEAEYRRLIGPMR